MQEISEMIGWCVWFSIIGMLMLISQLCKDRFEYVSCVTELTVLHCCMLVCVQQVVKVFLYIFSYHSHPILLSTTMPRS